MKKTVRIFISSPSDVEEERNRARQVIDDLKDRYDPFLQLCPVFWEDLPLESNMPFQQGIDLVLSKDGGVDIAIFILWARIGSPLGKTILKQDGSPYLSGTEREFDLMVQAKEKSGGERPSILFYNRKDDGSFVERLRSREAPEQAELALQKMQAENFMVEHFRDGETGVNMRAFHQFDRPVTFTERLYKHLETLLNQMVDGTVPVNLWDTTKNGAPFMGLQAFQPIHAKVFFGREMEILEARLALRKQAQNGCAFLLLSGASGSGKSSLARAGILPSVIHRELDSIVGEWRSIIVTPSQLAPEEGVKDIITGLVEQLFSTACPPGLSVGALSAEALIVGLKKNPDLTYDLAIKPAFTAAGKDGALRVVLLVDQLEELFTSASICADDRTTFLRILEIFAKKGDFWVLATIRSDFYPHIQNEPSLVRLKSGNGQFDVLPPNATALRRLIEEPARMSGLKFEIQDERSLILEILRDTGGHSELLPLLEFVLRELYEKCTTSASELYSKNTLTFKAYRLLGGVEGALANRADAVFHDEKLPEESRRSLSTVLTALVTVGHDGKQSGGSVGELPLARRRASLCTFKDNPAASALIQRFIAARLFTAEGDGQSGDGSITIAHESLIRVWEPAKIWSKANSERLLTRARIAARMEEGSPLLKGDPLLEAARLVMGKGFYNTDEQKFVELSLLNVLRKEFHEDLETGEKMDFEKILAKLQNNSRDLQPVLKAALDSKDENAINSRMNAVLLLGRSPEEPLQTELVRLVTHDPCASVRRAAASSLVQLNKPEYFDQLKDALQGSARSSVFRAMAHLRAAVDLVEQKSRYDDVFSGLSSRERARIIAQARRQRLERGWPTLFLALIPALALSSLFSAFFKCVPGFFNFALTQGQASFPAAFFQSVIACVFWGGIITFFIMLHKVVYRSEQGCKSILQPWSALVAGMIGGFVSSALLLVVVTLVCDARSTIDLGWTVSDWHKDWNGFWQDVLWNTRGVWSYMIMGPALGISMAMMANGVWASPTWKQLAQKESVLTGQRAIQLVWPLSKLVLPFTWILPVCMLLADVLAFYLVRHAPAVLGNGLHNFPHPVTYTNLSNALLDGRSTDAATVLAWKMSSWGEGTGILFDSITQAVGGFFCVVGMALALIAIQHGIRIEPRKT